MAGEMDAVNERLAGLVNLLQVVGIDGVDSGALMKQNGGPSPGRDQPSRGAAAPSESDMQILDLIRKLQHAQADSPEILAALKSPELRALATLAAQQQQIQQPQPKKAPAPALDDVMDDDDDNYPKIGPGYSDDISVVSDMTTPTVMTKQQVADEELYHEVNGGPGALPPAHVGMGVGSGAQQPARPTNMFGGAGPAGHHHHRHVGGKPNHLAGGGKTKNRVGQVRPAAARNAIAKSGGAAAQRRLNYQQAMQKLQTTDYQSPQAAGGGAVASSRGPTGQGSGSGTNESPAPEKSYMEHFSPKKTKEFFSPTSPTTSQNPMEFPSMAGEAPGSTGSSKKKVKSKSLLSRKGKNKSLAAQEASDFDFEGTDPIRAPPTPSGSLGSGSKKKATTSGRDVDWGITDSNGWPAFDGGKGGGGKDLFVDNDGFFPTDAFSGNDNNAFQGTSSSQQPTSRKVAAAAHDHDRPTSSRKTGKVKKEGDSKRDKDKSGKKKNRRASLSM